MIEKFVKLKKSYLHEALTRPQSSLVLPVYESSAAEGSARGSPIALPSVTLFAFCPQRARRLGTRSIKRSFNRKVFVFCWNLNALFYSVLVNTTQLEEWILPVADMTVHSDHAV